MSGGVVGGPGHSVSWPGLAVRGQEIRAPDLNVSDVDVPDLNMPDLNKRRPELLKHRRLGGVAHD